MQWRAELGIYPGAVAPLAISQVAPGLVVDGPASGLDGEVRELHRLRQERSTS